MSETYDDVELDEQSIKQEEIQQAVYGKKKATKRDAIDYVSRKIHAIKGTNGLVYVSVPPNGVYFELNGAGRQLIRLVYRKIIGGSVSNNDINEIASILRDSTYEQERVPTEPRIFHDRSNLTVYHDQYNRDYTCIRISPKSIEKIKQPSSFMFHRGEKTEPLPDPDTNGTFDDLMECFSFIDSIEDRHIIIAYMAHVFSMAKERLILYVHGPSESGKSAVGKIISYTIDPCSTDIVNAELSYPRRERDLMAAIRETCVLAYGNEGNMPLWLSQELCKRSTGGATSEARLYSQDVSLMIEGIRTIIINGLHFAPSKTDLQGRCISVSMTGINDDNWLQPTRAQNKYTSLRPKVLGALYKAVRTGLRRWDAIPSSLRMGRYSEFCRWVVAISPEWGWDDGYFPTMLQDKLNSNRRHAAVNDDVVQAVWMVLQGRFTDDEPLVCTYGEMARYIGTHAPWYRDSGRLSANMIREDLKERQGLLLEVGILYEPAIGSKHGSPTSRYSYSRYSK